MENRWITTEEVMDDGFCDRYFELSEEKRARRSEMGGELENKESTQVLNQTSPTPLHLVERENAREFD